MKKKSNTRKKAGKVATKEKVKKTIEKVNDTGNFIVENKTAFLVVGALLLGGIVIYNFRTGIKSVGKVLEADEVDFIDPNIEVLSKNLTINNKQAENLAKALLEAFNHTTFIGTRGTDEEKVKEAFTHIKTGDDFKLVYKAFGKRKRISGGTPIHWLDKKVAEEYDLVYWLKEELDSYWDKEIYNIVKEKVTSAGMIF